MCPNLCYLEADCVAITLETGEHMIVRHHNIKEWTQKSQDQNRMRGKGQFKLYLEASFGEKM